MKKNFLLASVALVIALCSQAAFSQVINECYFPKDNEIDGQYELDAKKLNANPNNYVWEDLFLSYVSNWKSQMNLEMERLISLVPEQENKIRESQKKWDESLASAFALVEENVDFALVGQIEEVYSYKAKQRFLYRERAKYYLCLYYTIKDQKNGTDTRYAKNYKTELAK